MHAKSRDRRCIIHHLRDFLFQRHLAHQTSCTFLKIRFSHFCPYKRTNGTDRVSSLGLHVRVLNPGSSAIEDLSRITSPLTAKEADAPQWHIVIMLFSSIHCISPTKGMKFI